jgi:cytochrome c oxidase subunit II
MPVQWMIGIAFVVLAGLLAAIFLWIALDARTESSDAVYQRAGVIRRRWFMGLLAFAVVAFVVSMTWLPYPFVRAAQLPGQAEQVAVTAHQYSFDLDTECLPSSQPIEFAVTSRDVTHGFAIYDPDGHIVGQTQAMPGYTNVLRIGLTTPGTYVLRCDELCGPGHAYMQQEITVGGCGANAAACGGGGCG